MTRRNVDEGRRPHRLDPKQRGRDHTRARNRRKRGQTEQTTDRRVDQLETWNYLNTSVATQGAGTTLIEVVTELPDATYLDIGRQVILRSPAAVHDILFVGMQLPDDTVAWIQWTANYVDSPNSPEFTFDKHVNVGQPVYGVSSAAAGYVAFNYGTADAARYTRGGSYATIAAGIPSGTNAGRGIYYNGTSVWVCVPSLDVIQQFIPPSTIYTGPTSTDFWALDYDTAGGRLVASNYALGRAFWVDPTTWSSFGNFATGCVGPEGIAADLSGNIYVADTGNNRIRKYNSSLALQIEWGSLGSGEGFFNAPKGMCCDSANRLYVADSGNNRIQVFDSSGTYLGKFGIGGAGSGQFSNPSDVSCYGNFIDVADTGNNRLSLWTRT